MNTKPTDPSYKDSPEYLSWGRVKKPRHFVFTPAWKEQILTHLNPEQPLLAYGKGRSYGDLCLNPDKALIDMSRLDHLIAFDTSSGILHCEAGLTMGGIIQLALPQGYFIPVSPGTKFVTLGGAIASDVHGKNHHVNGTIGSHIESIELLRTDGQLLHCSLKENTELFKATIGGMGLTGIILSAKIRLMKAPPFFETENIKFANLSEFFALNEESEKGFDYTVAWVDCTAKGERLGRGIYMRGNHVACAEEIPTPSEKVGVPFQMPNWLLNSHTVKAFNELYYHKQLGKVQKGIQNYDAFFYPLDSVSNWNRIYGNRGFYQYQFVIPRENREGLKEVFELISKSGLASFLAVLKTFGDVPSPGMMSFPKPGFTLALDFCNRDETTNKLFSELDRIIKDCDGRLYSAKDSHMEATFFRDSYENFETFLKHLDPNISSAFWRRINP